MILSVWAVVVCYSPGRAELTRLLDALNGQVANTLVMNNGGISPELLAELSGLPNVQVVDMGGNLGIAAPLNRAFEMMGERGVEFGVTFDQDSQPSINHVSALVRAWHGLASAPSSHASVGAIGPSFYDLRGGRFDYPFFRAKGLHVERVFEDSGERLPCADALITSGMLVPVKMWQKFHFIDELFIDYVDTEWCFRTRKAGYQHFGCFEVKMQHELSDGQPIVFAGMTLLRYSALRRYYYFRNGAYLATRNYVPLVFRIRLVIGMIVRAITSPFIDAHPLRSLSYIARGLRDAALGNFGRIDS
ncbi:glycosyltransferase family 2 protein [Cupriavidus sp. CuC1]|uniref:glycosyltransferase family 2 protein n=1 Tax=Cupriavidus sp. CuC1 TaxID=3373131 RepID=UPI0037CF709F